MSAIYITLGNYLVALKPQECIVYGTHIVPNKRRLRNLPSIIVKWYTVELGEPAAFMLFRPIKYDVADKLCMFVAGSKKASNTNSAKFFLNSQTYRKNSHAVKQRTSHIELIATQIRLFDAFERRNQKLYETNCV